MQPTRNSQQVSEFTPWTAPKLLKPNEIGAVATCLLNLGGIVREDLTLSDRDIADVHKLLRNPNAVTTGHSLWSGVPASRGPMANGDKPDVKVVACTTDCGARAEGGVFPA
jgi:S-disulfanyl-L-cysteine oxidoreductase SoxD